MTYVSHIQQASKALPGSKWMGDAGRIRSMLTRPKALVHLLTPLPAQTEPGRFTAAA